MTVCVLGSINWDTTVHVRDLPRPGETVLGRQLEQSPGGKGLNQAVAAARFGAITRLIGALGQDAPGARLRGFIREAGIDDTLVRDVEGLPTGQAFICLAANAENLIVVTAGSNSALGAAEGAEGLDARVLLTQCETPLAAIQAFFQGAPGRKLLNAAPAQTEYRAVFPLADILIVNQTELEYFSGRAAKGLEDAVPAARSLRSGAQTVIVTMGPKGAVAVGGDTVDHVPGHAVRAVDTVGAGDCFCGILAAALDEGFSITDAMRIANTGAALSVTRSGAAVSMPQREDVLASLSA
jgi:ribokinase